jgi:hypothetical protein
MAPILDQLRVDYAGRLEVTFVDVWKNPDQVAPYSVHVIPTRIFYAPDGRELAARGRRAHEMGVLAHANEGRSVENPERSSARPFVAAYRECELVARRPRPHE